MARLDQRLTIHSAEQAREAIPLSERNTEELVFAMVGPVGSGVSFASQILSEILQNEFEYDGTIKKLSQIINDCSNYVDETHVEDTDPHRVRKLQDIGTKLRAKFGADYISKKCIQEINADRGDPITTSTPRRYFTILDSVKHPEEVEILRNVYGQNFWLIGVFAPEDVRKQRLARAGRDPVYIEEIFKIDQDEGVAEGQNVRDTIHQSDFFIRNDKENDGIIRQTISRFLNVIFGIGVNTPTIDERSMQAAHSAASNSACLSRQVGAVIVTEAGEIIGHGANDVPQYGGGLYNAIDGIDDHRCFKWQDRICHNDARKKALLDNATQALMNAKVLKSKAEHRTRDAIAGAPGIKNLIEFSRSVHAEMEAIISVARKGVPGIVGATIYSTTFPCHSCARHIVASGISRVVYIEPYTKSLALELHSDAISISEDDQGRKVLFHQYDGVAPKNILRLFKDQGQRKEDGKVVRRRKDEASPLLKAPLDGFVTREQLVVADVSDSESPSKLTGEVDG